MSVGLTLLTYRTLFVQGFLPEAADDFIMTYVYTSFSPTVGLFLACSSAYGVWKIRQDKSL